VRAAGLGRLGGDRRQQVSHLRLVEVPGPLQRGGLEALVAAGWVGAEADEQSGPLDVTALAVHQLKPRWALPFPRTGGALVAKAHDSKAAHPTTASCDAVAMSSETTVRSRRQPPPFRRVSVRRVEHVTPRMIRVTLAGDELDGMAPYDPAASVRVLLPSSGERVLVMPAWNGNEFRLADGRRPTIRTFTPRRFDPEGHELDIDIVVHGAGVASGWAADADVGTPAAISGPGRGYTVDPDAPAYLLAGDETAIPAIRQVIEALPVHMPLQVHLEIAVPEAVTALGDHPNARVEWHRLSPGGAPGDALVAAVTAADMVPGTRVWAAGEAAAVQRIRRNLFEDRGVARAQASVRGYWKHGRSGDAEEA
jgi:NADPH-dependent ferric siderophore reductase